MDETLAHRAPRTASSPSRLWLGISLAYVFLRALPNLSYPIARDQAVHCVIGQGVLEGQQLYRDLWCNRPPGIFFLHALIVKVFGPVMWWVGVVDILWLLAISCLIFRFAERYLGTPAAVIAVVFHAAWHEGGGYWHAAQIEAFLMLFVLAAFFVAARDGPRGAPWQFAAGVVFGGAFWLKYNALAFLPLFFLVPYLDWRGLDERPRRVRLAIAWSEWRKRTAVFCAGFAVTLFVVLTYFWIGGSWEALKEVQLDVLPRYTLLALERTADYPLWAVRRMQFVVGLWTEVAALAALVIAWRGRELSRLGPVMLGAALGLISTLLQVRLHGYTFETTLPFLAMVWGYLGVKIYEVARHAARACAARRWRLARPLVWVVFANIVFWPLPGEASDWVLQYKTLRDWWVDRESFYSRYPWAFPISHYQDQLRVIAYVRENSQPGDKILVWGSEPLIYFLSERRPATRFVQNLALVSPWSPPAWKEEFVRTLEQSPPRFLVVARDDRVTSIAYNDWDSELFLKVYPELAIFISDYYDPAEDLPYFVIYRARRAGSESAPSADR